jgi:hypothetical protein
VPTLPVTLAHVQEPLDLLAVSIQRMAHAVADWYGEDGQSVDEDAAPPEARPLRWHLRTTAEALRDSREACSASGEWSRRLLDADEEAVPPTALDGSGSPGYLDMGCRAPAARLTRDGTDFQDGRRRLRRLAALERACQRAATLLVTGGRVVVVTASPSLGPPGVISEPILDAPPRDERSALLHRGRALLHQRGAAATLVATDSEPRRSPHPGGPRRRCRTDPRRVNCVGLRDARAPGLDSRERASPRALRRASRTVVAPASRHTRTWSSELTARSGRSRQPLRL